MNGSGAEICIGAKNPTNKHFIYEFILNRCGVIREDVSEFYRERRRDVSRFISITLNNKISGLNQKSFKPR